MFRSYRRNEPGGSPEYFKSRFRLAATRRGARRGLVHDQRPAAKEPSVKGVDGALGVVGVHFHEAEAARPSSLPIGDDLRVSHLPVRLEQRQQIVGTGLPRQIADVKSLRHANGYTSLPQ